MEAHTPHTHATATAASGAQRDTLLEAARALVPTLRARSREIAEHRSIPPDVMGLLSDAGLMQPMRPAAYGGRELTPDIVCHVARELARGDGSTAWVYSVTNSHDHFIGFYPKPVQDAYWASARPLSASSYMPSGRAERVDGGYRLSGKWSFSSGIDHCGWVVVGTIVGMLPGDRPMPDLRFMMLADSEFTIVDDWHVMGLAGTGSKSVVADNVFVPDERVLGMAEIQTGTTPGAQLTDLPIYHASAWPLFGFVIIAPAVGLVQGAYEVTLEQFRARAAKPDPMFEVRQGGGWVKLAEVSARIDAAALLFDRGLAETTHRMVNGLELPTELKARNRRDQTFGTHLLREAMATLMSMGGGNGLHEHNHVQRAFRDLLAVSAHPGGNWDVAAMGYGSVLTGGGVFEPLF